MGLATDRATLAAQQKRSILRRAAASVFSGGVERSFDDQVRAEFRRTTGGRKLPRIPDAAPVDDRRLWLQIVQVVAAGRLKRLEAGRDVKEGEERSAIDHLRAVLADQAEERP